MAEDKLSKTAKYDSWRKSGNPPDELNLDTTQQNRWRNFCKMSPTEEMSAAADDERDVTTTCCICDQTYRDPVLLPCTHTFCLTCLQHIGTYTDKNPGDQMLCPLCSQEFKIPLGGFSALKKNLTMIRLIEITATQQRASNAGQCNKHKTENICMYCDDCNEVLCLVCLREYHQTHRQSDLSKAADIINSELQCYSSAVKECMSNALKKKEVLYQKKFSVLKKIKGLETEVDQIRLDMKVIIDQHAESLLQSLDLLRKQRMEDVEMEEKELDKHIDILRNFGVRCAELSADGRSGRLFYEKANEMKEQIAELKNFNKAVLERQLRSFDINFTRTVPTLSEVYTAKNLIGVVKAIVDYRAQPELVTAINDTCKTTNNKGDDISGITVVNNNVFIVYEKTPVVSIYDLRTHKRVSQMILKGLAFELDFRHCVSVSGDVYIANRLAREIFRIDKNGVCTKWATNADCVRLSVSKESTILATCFEKRALLEYSLQGTLLREIELCSTIVHPLHAIKLRNGQFIVSHGTYRDPVNRVCMINDSGVITKSFGGIRGSSNLQVLFPTCLAVDESGNIFVLDKFNIRVLLLSPTLEFKMELLTKTDGLRRPVAMHFDENTSRLYIADNNWSNFRGTDCKVLVFNIR